MKENNIIIRRETSADFLEVEMITREAFWNIYCPGCDEHYLVHKMRNHEDFISELDFVMVLNEEIIGNIMYTKANLINYFGQKKEIVTFGPLTIKPKYQRKGYGKQLIEYSLQNAKKLGYDAVVIFGNPGNYVERGFKSCKKFNIFLEGNIFPTAMLAKELQEGCLGKEEWVYQQSSVMEIDSTLSEKYDAQFE